LTCSTSLFYHTRTHNSNKITRQDKEPPDSTTHKIIMERHYTEITVVLLTCLTGL